MLFGAVHKACQVKQPMCGCECGHLAPVASLLQNCCMQYEDLLAIKVLSDCRVRAALLCMQTCYAQCAPSSPFLNSV